MTRSDTPFADVSLEHAIALRWSLRDIQARRLKLTPLKPEHLETLLQMGLIAMNESQQPELTDAGREVIGD